MLLAAVFSCKSRNRQADEAQDAEDPRDPMENVDTAAIAKAAKALPEEPVFDIDPYTRDSAKVALYGQGGPDYTIEAEIIGPEGDTLHRHKKGALAAARRGDLANPFRESSGSQFYIVQSEEGCRHLDGQYTVFGETVAGLNVIDKIAQVKTGRMDLPEKEVRIISVKPDEELNK